MTPFYAEAWWRGHRARLLGTLTPSLPEWIDGLSNHCHDEDKLPVRARWRSAGRSTGDLRSRIWRFRLQK